jgi:hypothetical protein
VSRKFIRISFTSGCLYLGERIKKGTFKPSISPLGKRYKQKEPFSKVLPIPYSTITGALRSLLGDKAEIHAIGKIIPPYMIEYMAVTPYDSALVSAKLPITLEYLSGVKGEIYVTMTDGLPSLEPLRESGFVLGGMKSKGFGICKVESIAEIEPKIIEEEGRFLSRIYYDDDIMSLFGIRREDITKEYWGYLFKRTSEFNGYYQKSLFEQSRIKNGYDFLVEVIK